MCKICSAVIRVEEGGLTTGVDFTGIGGRFDINVLVRSTSTRPTRRANNSKEVARPKTKDLSVYFLDTCGRATKKWSRSTRSGIRSQ
jgi:hypothetical protein